MEDLALPDGTAVGSDHDFTIGDKRKKSHVDWPKNAEISVQAYLRRTIAKYSKTIRMKTKQDQAYYCRGTAKYQLDDYQGAVDDLTKAIELKPDFAEAYLNRAWAFFMLGEKKEALANLTKAKELGSPVEHEVFDIFRQTAAID